MNQSLIKYEAARRALAECKSVDEAKAWADKAAAMQAYQRMAGDKTLEVDAAEIRIRAERRLGELIADQKNTVGLNQGARISGSVGGANRGESAVVTNDHRLKLSDVGISKDQSSRAQKLAAVPAAVFEAELADKRERDKQDGARVSARLEAAGEQALKATARDFPSPGPVRVTKPEEPDEVEHASESELMEELHARIVTLTAELNAAMADDKAAENVKWRRAYDNAVRQQSEAMDKAAQAQRREKWSMDQLRRIGRAIGVDDPGQLARTVEKLVARFKESAA